MPKIKSTTKPAAKPTIKSAPRKMYGGPHFPVPYPLRPTMGILLMELKDNHVTIRIEGDELAMLREYGMENDEDIMDQLIHLIYGHIDMNVFEDFTECKQAAYRYDKWKRSQEKKAKAA